MSVETLDKIAAEDRADVVADPAAGVPGATAEAVPAGPTLAQEIEGLVTLAVKVLSPAFPSLPGIYTPDVTGAAAGAVAALCEKHGWLSGGLAGQYGEELAVAVIVGPLAVQTWASCKSDMEARRATRPAPEKEVRQVEADQPAPVPVAPVDPANPDYSAVLSG